MKRILMLVLALTLCLSAFTACSSKKTITIYSSAEDHRNVAANQMLNEKFPEYDINVIYNDTGTLSAKIVNEGKSTDADIILEMEATYLEKVSDCLAVLNDVDFSVYVDDLVPENKKYVPWTLMSGAVIVDKTALEEKGLAMPASYDDLLKPEYKGLISMPNPKSSGTGYIFLLNMINLRGEEAAFEYFDKLAENISGQGFTTSGSGPVKALTTGEAVIGLGMTFNAVEQINKGFDFEILFFDNSAPYTVYSSAVIAGKETDEDVMKVFNYILSDVTPKDKELYAPEKIYKDQTVSVKNFPENIPYGNMDRLRDIEYKESLLDKWNH